MGSLGILDLFDFSRLDAARFMANAYAVLSVVVIIITHMEGVVARRKD
jgi:hypothetical protein